VGDAAYGAAKGLSRNGIAKLLAEPVQQRLLGR